MSFFWWFFGALFISIGIYYAFVSAFILLWWLRTFKKYLFSPQVGYDKHSTKKKLRNGTIVNGAVVVDPNSNPNAMSQTTMIYTIPTTRQLSQQYPQMVTTYPYQPQQGHSQNSPPPYIGEKEGRVGRERVNFIATGGFSFQICLPHTTRWWFILLPRQTPQLSHIRRLNVNRRSTFGLEYKHNRLRWRHDRSAIRIKSFHIRRTDNEFW